MKNLNKKALKILLLTDSLDVGGAETHILTLASGLAALGHSVTVVSSGGRLEKAVRHKKINLSRRSLSLIPSFFKLLSFVRREKFDIIHSHARLPSLLGSVVAKILNIPFVTTVHARFKTSPLRRVFSRWGICSVAVSEDLSLYLTRCYSVPSENITVIENGLDFSRFEVKPCIASPKKILFLSRLDCDCSLCAELLCKIAPQLSQRYPDITISIGGGGERLEEIKRLAQKVNFEQKRELIELTGEVYDVPSFLSGGSAFVGVSRAALEAVATGIPTVIAGNEGFLGRLTSENFDFALSSNLCARGLELPYAERLFCELCALLDNYKSSLAKAQALQNTAKERLDISSFSARYEGFYFNSIELYNRKNERRAKTLLFGYYGYSNLGDDALLRASIKRAEREFGKGVAALTHKPKKASFEFLIPCFSRLSPFSIFYRIFRCERLIFGGGTLFQDITSRRSLLFYILVLRLAIFLKKEVILYANGIGNIESKPLSALLYSSLCRCSHIGVRDELSLASLRKNLPIEAQEKLCLEEDLALSLEASKQGKINLMLRSAFADAVPEFFIVCPRYISRFSRFELSLAIEEQTKKGLTPLFLPCSPDDLYIASELRAKFGGALIRDITFSDLLALLKRSSFLISMRYHPLVAAKKIGISALALGNDPKLKFV